MTKLEYQKMRVERRRKSHELLSRAQTANCTYLPDLIYFWEFMQEKNAGIRYCLGMIYKLGFADGIEYLPVEEEATECK
ncbi:hypothetical protein IMSAG049_00042 [Clostridiales bacterium]|nr:hypothetical protein IMSAG049_00042 [Clostridiales bacterium]